MINKSMNAKRSNFISFLLFCTFFLLPVDGFPLGMQFLREFGARPVNFLLVAMAILFVMLSLVNRKPISFRISKTVFILSIILLIIFSLNIFVVMFHSKPDLPDRTPISAWFFQYLMALWMFGALFIWLFLFQKLDILSEGYKRFIFVLAIAVILNLLLFFNDVVYLYNGSRLLQLTDSLLGFLRGDFKMRPSGVSTEPSLWGSWVAFVWPLLFFHDHALLKSRLQSVLLKSISIILIYAGYLSLSSTFLIAFIIQVLVGFGFVMLRKESFRKKHLMALSIAAAAIIFLNSSYLNNPYFERIALATDQQVDYSSMARIGSTVTSVNACLDHPILGIGLGQFSSYYSDYTPTFSMDSKEVQAWINRDTELRASTFNLITRVAAETGIITAMIFIGLLAVIYYMAFTAIKNTGFFDPLSIGIFLAIIGGTFFWLTQDQFGYQPAIVGLALGIYLYGENRWQPQKIEK